jgi:apolipoprotein N-acyltransferase
VPGARANRWLDVAVAVVGGLLWAMCFTRTEYVLLPWIALAPLVWLLGRPRAALLALIHGTVSWIAAIPWIIPTLVTYGEIPRPLAIVLFTLLAAYLGAYHAAFAWLARPLWRHGGPALLALPALWCVLEVVRSWLISGFPWNLAGTAWIAVPGALVATSWIGVHGVSFLLVLANAGFARAFARRRWEPAAGAALSALLVLAFAARWAGPRPEQGPPIPVRILQPNTPILDLADRAEIADAYQKMLQLSRDACDRKGALVLWPESAGWPYILERDAGFRADVEAQAARGCGILLNSPRFDDDLVYNAAFLIRRGADTVHYDKRHLVPFGEYVPMQEVLPFVGALARNAGSFVASDRISLLHYGPVELGLAICFEITFPAEVAALAREGATALATLTNDAWYGNSSAPWQHLRAARFRAAENHRTVLRAALTGVSAWIEPDGSLAATLSVGEQGILRGELAPRHELTPLARAPWTVPIVCLSVCVAAFLFVIFDRRSRLADS